VLLLGACTARYVSIGPGGHHRFDIDGQVRDIELVSPTILGWVFPGDRTRVESAQFSPDGEWLYLSAGRGVGDQLATVTLYYPQDGLLIVDVRLITIPSPGRSAVGLLFGTRVHLQRPIVGGHPPLTVDDSTGDPIAVGNYLP
jgi:hypothetical protein